MKNVSIGGVPWLIWKCQLSMLAVPVGAGPRSSRSVAILGELAKAISTSDPTGLLTASVARFRSSELPVKTSVPETRPDRDELMSRGLVRTSKTLRPVTYKPKTWSRSGVLAKPDSTTS